MANGDMLKSVYDKNNNGVVDQAAKLQTPRSITITGGVTGSASFDGTSDITIPVSVNSDVMKKSYYDTNGDGIIDQAAKLQTARTIALTGGVTGSATFDGSANITIATTATGSGTGNMSKSVYDTNNNNIVDSAEKLSTARTISLSGDAAGSISFDGSANVTIPVTVTGSGGTSPSIRKTDRWVNVKTDFGAVGDGITDDTLAFQNAVAYLKTVNAQGFKGGVLFVPQGLFSINKQLILENIIIKGVGEGSSVIKVNTSLGTGVAALVMQNSSRAFTCGMEDVAMFCNNGSKAPYGSKNHGCDGIEITTYMFLNRATIENFDMGIRINSASHCSFTNCHIQDCYYNIYFEHDEGDHYFSMCVLDGASMASIGINGDDEGHPKNTFVSCHVGFAPFGIHHMLPTTLPTDQGMMVEWYFDGMRFEACGNAAIYSEAWNVGIASNCAIIGCTFKNVGFSFEYDTMFKLPNYPKDCAIYVNQTGGTIIYEPGAGPFYKYGSDSTGAIKITYNNADWIGSFLYTDFNILGGSKRIFPTRPVYFDASDWHVSCCMVSDHSMAGDNPIRRIIVNTNGLVTGDTGTITAKFPVPFTVPPKLSFNYSGMADSVFKTTTTEITVSPGDWVSHTGFAEFIGY